MLEFFPEAPHSTRGGDTLAQKVAKAGVKREDGYLYFIDKQGTCPGRKWPAVVKGGKPTKVAKVGVKKEKGYLYFLDKQGTFPAPRWSAVNPVPARFGATARGRGGRASLIPPPFGENGGGGVNFGGGVRAGGWVSRGRSTERSCSVKSRPAGRAGHSLGPPPLAELDVGVRSDVRRPVSVLPDTACVAGAEELLEV